jgi:protein required for attachment to host cells
MADTVDWVLVADRTRARLLHALPKDLGASPTLAAFVHEAGRLQRRERESDIPGRIFHPGGARSLVEPHEDIEHRESRKFAAKICDYLDQACLEGRFDRLIVVAPPDFLGVLRDEWPEKVRARIVCELGKELAGLTDPQLQARLEEIMAAVPA